jgi:hypothetical protein
MCNLLRIIVGPTSCLQDSENANLPDRGMNIRKEVSSWQEKKNPRQTFLQEQITKAKAVSAATAGKK